MQTYKRNYCPFSDIYSGGEQMVLMDTHEREPNRHFDNCNWTLKYRGRHELIFHGMREQIKARTPAYKEQHFILGGIFKITGRQSVFRDRSSDICVKCSMQILKVGQIISHAVVLRSKWTHTQSKLVIFFQVKKKPEFWIRKSICNLLDLSSLLCLHFYNSEQNDVFMGNLKYWLTLLVSTPAVQKIST